MVGYKKIISGASMKIISPSPNGNKSKVNGTTSTKMGLC